MNRQEAHLRNEAKFANLARAKEQMELRYAHLGHRRTPAREAQQASTAQLIAEIQAEQELCPAPTGPPLPLAPRYAACRPRGSSPTPT